jgi:hypothetical protein
MRPRVPRRRDSELELLRHLCGILFPILRRYVDGRKRSVGADAYVIFPRRPVTRVPRGGSHLAQSLSTRAQVRHEINPDPRPCSLAGAIPRPIYCAANRRARGNQRAQSGPAAWIVQSTRGRSLSAVAEVHQHPLLIESLQQLVPEMLSPHCRFEAAIAKQIARVIREQHDPDAGIVKKA